jgi:hypothetical protein
MQVFYGGVGKWRDITVSFQMTATSNTVASLTLPEGARPNVGQPYVFACGQASANAQSATLSNMAYPYASQACLIAAGAGVFNAWVLEGQWQSLQAATSPTSNANHGTANQYWRVKEASSSLADHASIISQVSAYSGTASGVATTATTITGVSDIGSGDMVRRWVMNNGG